MSGGWTAAVASAAAALLVSPVASGATFEPHPSVRGVDVVEASVRVSGGLWRATAWEDLRLTPAVPGRYQVRFSADGGATGASLEVPPCAGRERIEVDGRAAPASPGPVVVALPPGPHDVLLTLQVSGYEGRIACGESPRTGAQELTREGLGLLTFSSPWSSRGGGRAVVYVPPHHDLRTPGPLLVGLHPWNGSVWTYAAYAELLHEARARDLVLVMPSGLGNSLYTADAEDEVMRSIAALSEVVAVDARAVSLWGASMGGAGATTIGFHHPDRFAFVASFFGDSRYDISTYVRSILPNEAAAHRVNALDVVDNARHLPVWLVHGEEDRTSPIRQSELLARAMQERGFHVRFDRVPGMGHSGSLVARFLSELVDSAASARLPDPVARVTYRSVRAIDTGAYGVRIVRGASASSGSTDGDAFIDVERRDDAVHVSRADGVRAVVLERGALGTSSDRPPGIVVDDPRAAGLDVRWRP
jgi:enterochelin esterase-like enzyme